MGTRLNLCGDGNMDNVINCKRCFSLAVQTSKTGLCPKCAKTDAVWLEIVLDYLRKRENRAATIVQVLNATGVNEDWIYDWVRDGKILQRHFPNLGAPCPKCGKNLTDGVTLCTSCKGTFIRDLKEANEEEAANQSKSTSAYFIKNN
jgi:flagellar operon protein (TIGR03826 family)